MIGKTQNLIIYFFVGVLLFAAPSEWGFAQNPITFQYVYDETGQLIKAIDSTGTIIEYVYDEVGNLLEIKRSMVAGPVAVFHFNPQEGPVLTAVTIQGQGFSPVPAENIVEFNGVPATVNSSSPQSLSVTVPVGATTGPVSVSVLGNTGISNEDFSILPVPVITSISPSTAVSGSFLPIFHVEGLNLTGSTFSFNPLFSPPKISINSFEVDPVGTSASLNLIIENETQGSFVVVATNSAGSSDAFPTSLNSLTVIEGVTEVVGNSFSLLNGFVPLDASLPGEVVSQTVSVLNGSLPFDSSLPGEAVSPTFSVDNLFSP